MKKNVSPIENTGYTQGLLTVFARIPPKLAVSYPNSISPTSKEKHEKMSNGDIKAMLARRFAMLKMFVTL